MIDLDFLGSLAGDAAAAILEVYETEFSVEQKEDRSPLTLADRRSHEIISKGLRQHYPNIPILSEEGKEVPYSERKKWSSFWCVDPLDGTKEFIKKNGEFTINIALIEGDTPTVGLIYVPVQGILYAAHIGEGCWEIADGKRRRITVAQTTPEHTPRVLKSRSHPSPHLEALLEPLSDYEALSRGSALKFCSIASGVADFYPRLGPTWEWDTAAGQAIVTAAGGAMVDFKGKAFTYNKPDLLNGPFLVASSLGWLEKSGILARAAALDLS